MAGTPARFTVDQYHKLVRAGILTDADPIELLEGLLVLKAPKTPPHSTASGLVRRELARVLPAGWHYQSHSPVTLDDGEPEPDGVVVRGRIEDYATGHPRPVDVALVIEVADSGLDRDQGMKLRSYARAGIPVYWIINLVDRQVEVYTSPTASVDADPMYLHQAIFRPGDGVRFALPNLAPAAIPVTALLPPT